jgi:hypothetical protein
MAETLHQVTGDVWVAHELFALPGGVRMRLNMTVLRLRDGSLLLHSPVVIDDPLAGALAAIGPVRHVVAPSSYHHLFVTACLDRYPRAALYLAPGLPAKRADLKPAGILGADTPPWAGEVDALVIEGTPKFREVAFFHRPAHGEVYEGAAPLPPARDAARAAFGDLLV